MRTESLVVATVFALVAGCVTPSLSPALAPSPMPEWMTEIDWDPLRTTLQLPTIQAGDPCPVTAASTTSVPNVSSVLGEGPIFPWGTGRASLGEDLFFDGDVYRLKVLWIIDPDRYNGPALIRGGRIDGPSAPLVFFYTDHGPFAELRLGRQGWVYGGTGMHEFNSETGFSGNGCFAYQVDGIGFSESVVVEIAE